MKPSKILLNLKTQLLTNYVGEMYANAITSISIFSIFAAIIWIAGPTLSWHGFTPFALDNQRFYAIASLFLLCVLKILLIDLDATSAPATSDPILQKKLQSLKNRFDGVIAFLKNTTTKQDQSLVLDELPWFLLIGPNHAGKTSLLANAQVNYILQRQFAEQDLQHLQPSEHCDWWLTRNAAIIDVPSRYLAVQAALKKAVVWDYFLNLIKTERGNKAITGIVIALPLSDMMHDPDTKHYQQLQHRLLARINDIRNQFSSQLTCYVVITKCDKIPGFAEFFGESGSDEITQAWGITLTTPKNNGSRYDACMHQLNALIKKLNQQLLWRLHHERNPMARPAIKDFPLQVERMKEFMMSFIKKLASNKSGVTLQGIYFTSALQQEKHTSQVIDEDTQDQRAMQLFKEPLSASRAYFIKQFINQALQPPQIVQYKPDVYYKWKLRIAYATSAAIIGTAAVILGKNFAEGVKETYTVQNHFTDYQLSTLQIQDPILHLEKTLTLLNQLQEAALDTGFKLDLKHIMAFYSHQSQEKAAAIYQQALRDVLLPEIKLFFEEYLDNPVNKNTEYVYETLKAYLMLGDSSRYNSDFIMKTFEEILPANFTKDQIQQLMTHLQPALNGWSPMQLNTATILDTRKFLLAMPTIQLSYIILKNIDNNNALSNINLGLTPDNTPTLVNRQAQPQLITMFTGKSFMPILSQEINYAASEAVTGNWVLSDGNAISTNPTVTAALIDQLRLTYVTNYVNAWENVLNNVDLAAPTNLVEADHQIINLISNHSPMLQLLKTLHENTYFEPIITASPKLQNVGALIERNRSTDSQLYQIFAGLQNLHVYVQSILSAENEKKAAFDAISSISTNLGKVGTAPDSITQLRIIASQCPEPVKSWLNKIANNTWRFLLQDASHYLDTSWKEQVNQFYENEMVDHYPFNIHAENEMDLQKFAKFFGNPGILPTFYNNYLQALIDTSAPTWRWKTINNEKLPFSDDTLRQIQQAMRIHQLFFPNNDNNLSLQFALQPYKFDAKIKKVKLSINDKQIIDEKAGPQAPHMIAWPASGKQATSVQLTLANNQVLGRTFTGEWSWFKLLNQSFESMVSKKEVIINLSVNDNSAKYLVFTEGQVNPLFSLNLSHFQLSPTLLNEKA